ncbi:unnamed protein product [Phytophthora lilii]|uniref:Unnamed protein product n=1 Tax=Phytophthora lilii TaxID=2077276 RepID=A0A9W6X4T1_9STRA|nr:unnamed protein product [Phytophthora lilii]
MINVEISICDWVISRLEMTMIVLTAAFTMRGWCRRMVWESQQKSAASCFHEFSKPPRALPALPVKCSSLTRWMRTSSILSERIHKDVSAAFVLTADQHEAEDDTLVVTLRRAAFVKLYYPEFDISEAVWQEVQQDVARWGDITTRAIRSVLYSVP